MSAEIPPQRGLPDAGTAGRALLEAEAARRGVTVAAFVDHLLRASRINRDEQPTAA